MDDDEQNASSEPPHRTRKRWWQRTWFKWLVGISLAGIIVLVVAAEYALRNAAPILRKRIIATLSQRFNAPVELDTLDISLFKGVQVSGSGLRIPYGSPSRPSMPGPPHILIGVGHFSFRSDLMGLLHARTTVATVYVDDVIIDLPPGPDRKNILGPNQNAEPADPEHPRTHPRIALVVNEIRARNVKLIIESKDPNKEPREFDIEHLLLDRVNSDPSYTYDAHLTNPIPRGEIDAKGHVGPWDTDEPRQTHVDGDYTFVNADLNTIKGIGGTLNSTGHFDGVLERITIDGETRTPDFSLDISDHPMPLTTKFHAYVDGTTGDTELQPVNAVLGSTPIVCRGKIVNLKGKGHDIALDAVIPRGHMRDVLALGMKSPRPIMHGVLSMKTKIHIPPGKVRVAAKIELAGTVTIHEIVFTNPAVQDRLDGLSLRAQGKPGEVAAAGSDKHAEVQSSVTTNFSLAHSQMTFHEIVYEMPGAHIRMDGIYDLNGDAFLFKGRVRTEATASQMISGWKSWLLKPVDPFLKKNGAGVELPIQISGVKNDVHFGLAFKHGDDTPTQIRQELHDKRAAGTFNPPGRKKNRRHEGEVDDQYEHDDEPAPKK